jgi:hypothetical protein
VTWEISPQEVTIDDQRVGLVGSHNSSGVTAPKEGMQKTTVNGENVMKDYRETFRNRQEYWNCRTELKRKWTGRNPKREIIREAGMYLKATIICCNYGRVLS